MKLFGRIFRSALALVLALIMTVSPGIDAYAALRTQGVRGGTAPTVTKEENAKSGNTGNTVTEKKSSTQDDGEHTSGTSGKPKADNAAYAGNEEAPAADGSTSYDESNESGAVSSYGFRDILGDNLVIDRATDFGTDMLKGTGWGEEGEYEGGPEDEPGGGGGETEGEEGGEESVDEEPKPLESIKIFRAPHYKNYNVGDSFIATGLVIEREYEDGSTKILEYDGNNKDLFTFTPQIIEADTEFVTVTYAEKTAKIPVTVAGKKTVGIDWGQTEFTYDFITKTVTATPTWVEEGDDVSFTYENNETYKNSDAKAGTYTAKINGLAGADANKYRLPSTGLEKEWKINKRVLEFTVPEPQAFGGIPEESQGIVNHLIVEYQIYDAETGELVVPSKCFLPGHTYKVCIILEVYDYTSVDMTNNGVHSVLETAYGYYSGVESAIVNGIPVYKNGPEYEQIVTAENGWHLVVNYTFPPLEDNPESIKINTNPSKLEYVDGETFDPTGLCIKKVYDIPSHSQTEEYSESTKDKFTFTPQTLTAGTTSVTVTYAGKQATIPVTVTVKKAVGINWGQSTYEYNPLSITHVNMDKNVSLTGVAGGDEVKIVFDTDGDYVTGASDVGTYRTKIKALSGKDAGKYRLPDTGTEFTWNIIKHSIRSVYVFMNYPTAGEKAAELEPSVYYSLTGNPPYDRGWDAPMFKVYVNDTELQGSHIFNEGENWKVEFEIDVRSGDLSISEFRDTPYGDIVFNHSTGENDYPAATTVRDGKAYVTYQGTVVTIDGISIKTRPKTNYKHGDTFDPSGLEIEKYYSFLTDPGVVTYSESTADRFTFSPTTITGDTTAVTVTYGGKTATIPVTVERTAVGINWETTVFTYNGDTQSVEPVLTGVAEDDDVRPVYDNGTDYKCSAENAGTYRAKITGLTGDDAGKYVLSAANREVTWKINKKMLTFTWPAEADRSFTYDGNEKIVEAAVNGIVDSDDVTVIYENSRNTNVSDCGYEASIILIQGNDAGNYELPDDDSRRCFYRINPAEIGNIELIVTEPVKNATVVNTAAYKDGNPGCGNDTVDVVWKKGSDPVTEEKFLGNTVYTAEISGLYADQNHTFAAGMTVKVNGKMATYADGKVTYTFDRTADRSVSIISIITEPYAGKSYTYGQTFNPVGLVIHAVYDDGTFADVSYSAESEKFSFSPELDKLTAVTTAITVTYGGKSAQIEDITVAKKKIELPVNNNNPIIIYNESEYTNPLTVPEGSEIVTDGSVLKATNAGTYTVYFKLKDAANTEWTDETIENKHATWTIKQKEIPTVTVTGVTPPAKGAVPSASVTVAEDTLKVDTVSWSPADEKFRGGKSYSITVKVSPKDTVNYKFADSVSATVNGNSIGALFNSETGALSYDYPNLDAKELSSVSVATAPTKTGYTYGETFDPSGLVITRHYDDGTTEDLGFGTGSGITVEPEKLTAGLEAVTIKYDGKSTAQAVTVAKKPIVIKWPESATEKTFTYDGTDKTVIATPEGILSGDSVTVSYSNNVNRNAGSHEAEITGLDGADAANYELPATGLKCSYTIEQAVIESIELTVAKPIKNQAISSEVTKTDSSYTAGTAAWKKGSEAVSEAVFLGNTVYTAEIPVSADANHRFADGVTVKVNGRTATYADGKVTCVFEKTEDKNVKSIEITGRPLDTSYVYGETPDLCGLEIHVVYDDDTFADVSYSEESASFSFSPELDKLTAGTTAVTVTYGGKNTVMGGITVAKKQIPAPSDGAERTYNGNEYSHNIEVPEGSEIVSEDSVLEETKAGTYTVYFKLKDTANTEWTDESTDNKSAAWTIKQKEISTVTVTGVTPPAKGAVPSSAASVSESGLSVESVVWKTEGSVFSGERFLGGKAYTVEIKVKPDGNHVLAGTVTASVNSQAESAVVTDGKALVSHNFGTLSDSVVTEIRLTDESVEKIKRNYTYGDSFDPSEIVITKTLDDGTVTDVSYSEESGSFTFSPVLDGLTAETDKVTVSYGGKSIDIPVTVAKKQLSAGWTEEGGRSFVYNGNAHSITASLEGAVKDDVPGFSYKDGSNTATNAGSYTAKIELDEETKKNYILPDGSDTCTFTIEQAVINSISLSLTGPQKNGTPDTVAETPSGAGYSAGTVVWKTGGAKYEGEKFEGDTEYTAEITVEADGNHRLADTVGVTVEGSESAVYAGGKVTCVFAKTAARNIEGVSTVVGGEPEKKEYTYGEKIDLVGLKIHVEYDDGTSENIPYSGNESSFSIDDDTPDAGTTSVTVTYGDKSIEITGINIDKKELSAGWTEEGGRSFVYDGNAHGITAALEGAVEGDVPGFSYKDGSNTATDAGTHTAEIVLDADTAKNYSLPESGRTCPFTIEQAVINSISLSLTTPQKNGTPDTVAETPSGAGYSAGEVVWKTGDSAFNGTKFEGNTEYTAEITVEADGNHRFAGTVGVTVDGSESAVYADGRVTVRYAETDSRNVSVISIPDSSGLKKEYEYGDDVILDGLRISVTYDDGTADEIEYDGHKSSFSVEPEKLLTTGESVSVTVTYGGTTAEIGGISVSPKTLGISWPVEKSFVYNRTERKMEAELTGRVGEDDVRFVYSGNKASNAGSYSAEITGLEGTDKDRYALPESDRSCDWVISQAEVNTVTVTEITAPAKGAAPSDSAAVSEETLNVGTASWTPEDVRFLGGKEYTVSVPVTLKDAENYKFADTVEAKISVTKADGEAEYAADFDDGTATVSYTFAELPESVLEKIEITEDSAEAIRKEYSYGDEFDPAGLVIKKTMDDGTVSEVSWSEGSGEFTITPEKLMEVGTVDVTVSCGDVSTTVPVTVGKKELQVVWPENRVFIYDGEEKTFLATVTGFEFGDSVGIGYNCTKRKNAGSYTAEIASLELDDSYKYSIPENGRTCDWFINKAEVDTVTVTGIAAPAKGKIPSGTAEVSEETLEAYPASWNAPEGRFLGGKEYTVSVPVRLKDSANYKFAESVTAKITVNGENGESGYNVDYDAETGTVSYTFEKLPESVLEKIEITDDSAENVRKEYSYGDEFDPAGLVIRKTMDDGTESYVTAGGEGEELIITPEILTEVSDSAEITISCGGQSIVLPVKVSPKELHVGWQERTWFDYDGTEHTVTAALTGIIGEDEVRPVTEGNTARNAGSYRAQVTGLDGADAAKYVLPEDEAELVSDYIINRIPLTVTAKPNTITKGSEPANDGVLYAGFAEGDTAGSALNGSLTFTYTYDSTMPAGSYDIVPGGLTSDNYDIVFVKGVLTVKAKSSGSGSGGGGGGGGTGSRSGYGTGGSGSGGGNAGGPGSGPGGTNGVYDKPMIKDAAITEGTWIRIEGTENEWRFVKPDGSSALNGWVLMKDPYSADPNAAAWFYFYENGTMAKGWVFNYDGSWYYTGTDADGTPGRLAFGWYTNPQDGCTYYLNPADGIMATGWMTIEGKDYYFTRKEDTAKYAWNAFAADSSVVTNTILKYALQGNAELFRRNTESVEWKYTEPVKHPCGSLYRNETTPDGIRTGSDGAKL